MFENSSLELPAADRKGALNVSLTLMLAAASSPPCCGLKGLNTVVLCAPPRWSISSVAVFQVVGEGCSTSGYVGSATIVHPDAQFALAAALAMPLLPVPLTNPLAYSMLFSVFTSRLVEAGCTTVCVCVGSVLTFCANPALTPATDSST